MFTSDDLAFDRQHIWHPYTSMTQPLPVYPVVSANGCELQLADGRKLIDGMSSWWTTIHGYNHPHLNEALYQQSRQMSHVMFGGITHPPAVALCRKLLKLAPASLECIFLADSGSVAVEVALKMALQYWIGRGEPRHHFISLRHGYHGDTFGAMSVSDPQNTMHHLWHGYLPEHKFVPSPQSLYGESWQSDDIQALAHLLAQYPKQIAALIVEPIVQAAGGMRFYHPKWLQEARRLCDEHGVLLIADEIATGFGRTGKLFACEYADITPDIMCAGKGLTGGMMTLAATLCSRQVAQTLSGSDAGCLMHGPTFMGNPLACAVACASMELLETGQWREQIPAIEQQMREQLAECTRSEQVTDVRVLGAIGVVEMKTPVDVAHLQRFFVESGVWIRPFGRLIYLMPPYVIQPAQLSQLTAAICAAVSSMQPPHHDSQVINQIKGHI